MSWQRSVMCPAWRRGWMRQRVARPEAGPPGPPLPPPPHTSPLPGLAAAATRPEGHPGSRDTSRPDLLPPCPCPRKPGLSQESPLRLAQHGPARHSAPGVPAPPPPCHPNRQESTERLSGERAQSHRCSEAGRAFLLCRDIKQLERLSDGTSCSSGTAERRQRILCCSQCMG